MLRGQNFYRMTGHCGDQTAKQWLSASKRSKDFLRLL